MASSVKGMTIELGGDTSKLQAALKQLNKPIQSIQDELRGLNSSLKLDPGNTTLLTNKQQLLSKQITETKEKISILKQKIAELNDIQAKNGSLTEEQQNQYRKLTTELAKSEIELKGLQKQYSEFGSVASQKLIAVGGKMEELGNAIQEVGKKLSIVSGAMSALLLNGVKYTADLQKIQAGLKTATGSAEAAEEVMSQIKQDAKTTPFDVKGLAQANQLLLSTGMDASEARDLILALGDAVAASGGGNDELQRMAYNLQQVKNLGVASSVDIKQFGMAGIDIYGLLADYLGITKEEAADTKVTFEQLSGALMKASSEGGKYFGGMEEQSQTLNGQMSNLKDTFNEFTAALSKNLVPIIQDLLVKATDLLNKFNEMDPETQSMISNLAIIVAAASPVLTIVGKFVSLLGTLTKGVGSLLKVVPKITGFISGLVEVFQLVAGGAGTLNEALVAVFGTAGTVAAGILSVVGGAVVAIKNFIDMLMQGFSWIKEAFMVIGIAIAAVGAIILGVPAAIAAAIATVVAAVATLVVVVKQHWETIKAFFVEAFNAIGNFFTQTIPNWINFLTNEVLPHLPYYIGYMLGFILGKIVEFIANAWTFITTKVPQIIANVVSFVSTLPGKLWSVFTLVLAKVREWLGNWLSTVAQKIPEIVNSIKEKFMQLPGQMLSIGRNIVEGLWNGIKNAGGWIKEKVGEFARGILDGMKAALGINSPSTLFRDQVGKYIAEGIGVGFSQNIGGVLDGMQSKLNMAMGDFAVVAPEGISQRGSVNISMVINAQELNEQSLEQAFNYINRRFGTVL